MQNGWVMQKTFLHYNELLKHNLIYLMTYSILAWCLQVRDLLIKCLVINNKYYKMN